MDVSGLKLSPSCQVPLLLHYYEKYLPQVGTFVEIGAFDGESFSNTSCLADAGWNGSYIEPIPDYAKRCETRHINNAVRVYNLAIGDTEGFLEINVGHALTTANEETLLAYRDIEWSKNHKYEGKLSVPVLPLNEFLRLNNIAAGFDLLVVDVEGFEEKVFGTFDLGYWQPTMIIVGG